MSNYNSELSYFLTIEIRDKLEILDEFDKIQEIIYNFLQKRLDKTYKE